MLDDDVNCFEQKQSMDLAGSQKKRLSKQKSMVDSWTFGDRCICWFGKAYPGG